MMIAPNSLYAILANLKMKLIELIRVFLMYILGTSELIS